MQDKSELLTRRMLKLAAGCIGLAGKLARTMPGRYIAGQLVRSSASVGANYQEACGAESLPDFVHKMQIVLKELRESRFWLALIQEAGLLIQTETARYQTEVEELIRIVAKSIVTAKSRLKGAAPT